MKGCFKGNECVKYNNSAIMKNNIRNVMYNLHKYNDVNVLHHQYSHMHVKHFTKNNPRYYDINTSENAFKQAMFLNNNNNNNNSNTISINTNYFHKTNNNNINYNTLSLQNTTRTSNHNMTIQSSNNKKQYRKLYFNSSMNHFNNNNNNNTFNQRSINIINNIKPSNNNNINDSSNNNKSNTSSSSKYIYFKQQNKPEYSNEQNSLFELAQSMLLIRKNSNDHCIQSYEETKKINNHKTLNRIPINQRLRVLKEIKNNIKDTLNSSIEDNNNNNNTNNNILKRSASAQPSEKGFEKEMNKMVKSIFYPHKMKHKHIINQQHFNTSNNNNNNNSSMSSMIRNNSGNGFYITNYKRELESPKLLKQTKRPKINVPVYKDM